MAGDLFGEREAEESGPTKHSRCAASEHEAHQGAGGPASVQKTATRASGFHRHQPRHFERGVFGASGSYFTSPPSRYLMAARIERWRRPSPL